MMNPVSDIPLFRPEAVSERRQRIEGEVILLQPAHAHALVALILVITVALLAWVANGSYSRTEVAKGILATDSPSAKIMAIRPGLVTRLFVQDGDLVKAGQIIATIRTEQSSEGGPSAIAQGLVAIGNQQALAREQTQLARERTASDRTKLSASLAGFTQQQREIQGQISIQEQLVASADEMLRRVLTLAPNGFISKIEVEQRKQQALTAKQELLRLNQQLANLDSEIGATKAELVHSSYQGDSEVATAQASAQTLVQQAAQLQGQQAYTIIAPIAGRVTAVQTGVGRTTEGNIPLMEIVPEGSPLHAEVYAPTRAIGFVRPGQEVRLLFDAFPYQRHGSFSGRVTKISRTVIDPREIAAPLEIKEPVYRIEVAPAVQGVTAYDKVLPLQPGMTLTANLILDRRSFTEWLLAPLYAVIRRKA
jgi:membrane fusion protein